MKRPSYRNILTAEMDTKVEVLREKYYPKKDFIHHIFYDLVRSYLKPNFEILDAGSGPFTNPAYDFGKFVKTIIGIDKDPSVKQNGLLNEAYIGNLDSLPFENNRFDLIFTRYVFEHLTNPIKVVNEFNRVLRPNGIVALMTPCKWSYVCLVSRVTPLRFHKFYKNLRGFDRHSLYPTYYRANSAKTILEIMSLYGFAEDRLILVESDPSYLDFNKVTFLLGVAWERIINKYTFLKGVRNTIIASFIKKKELM